MLGPLRHVPFRFLVAGRTINALGNAIAPVALAFAVLDLTGSATDLGLVVGARMLANVLFLLFGGALADRVPKNLLMVGSSIAAAVTQAAVAAMILSGTATVPFLIVLSSINGMVAALALPASSAILPQLLPADLRQQANAISRLSFNGAMIMGAPVGGIIVAAISPGWGIAIDAVAFLCSAACFALLRIPPAPAVPAERAGIVAELRTGWTEFRSRTWLWVVVAAFSVINACISGGINVLGPLVADETVGRRAWGFVLAAQTLGMLLGALIAMRLRVRRLLFVGVLCTAFEVLPVLTLGVAPHLGLLMAATFLAGLTIEEFGIAWETTMQEHVPADKLARVYSYDMVGSYLAIPVGQVATGPIAEAIGVRPTLIGAAGLIALAVVAMTASSDVRNLRHELSTGSPTEEKAPARPMGESTP
ncbi:MFS transporter [Winogradskya consettensis]|uniref:MFS transporter n=1 Tax=Winogradskya consettensis TaxID=113560 RepID=A0A919T4Q7_9ACTN|nr:MFS transporter [Actinoplanes consettensis]GIM84872.1 MFS transporter [Actinoplanes consettensis]